MSGGTWGYIQYRFTDIIESLKHKIINNGKELSKEELKSWKPEDKFHYKYPDEVIEEFKKGVEHIQKAQIYTQRIDWLLAGDDGDKSFLERLKEGLNNLNKKE